MTLDRAPVSLGRTATAMLRKALESDGILLPLGALTVRFRSALPELADVFRRVYPEFPFIPGAGYADTCIDMLPQRGSRRWVRPLARLEIDGIDPFGAFPRAQSMPYFEWGVNWAFANMFNAYLLLHSGTLDIGGVGVLLVAQPGSGKSTLTAALVARGGRLLSDEFGVVRRSDLELLPVVKPIALKNESIEAIARWSPGAQFGPVFRNTRKGNLAHLAVPADSVARCAQTIAPRVVIFPSWRRDCPAELVPVAPARAFMELALNSFNYETLGPSGFATVADLIERCDCYRFVYGDLAEAVPRLVELCEYLGPDHA